MSQVAKEVAEKLLEIGAIKLSPNDPFKWSSGWLSPIYCDNRLTLSYPEVRNYIKKQFVETAKKLYPQADAIAGIATAGIPLGALLADELNLPFMYVRPKPKSHGLENLIEGRVYEGQKVILIEDLISTGGSSIKAATALREEGVEILGLLAIFSYGFKLASLNFAEVGIEFHTLSNYKTLLEVALSQQAISENDVASLEEWRKNPEIWGVTA